MDINFPESPPIDPMDGDYLRFEAMADGQLINCCITFNAITPRSNNPHNAKLAFGKKKDQIHATARALIEAGEIDDGEILITSLKHVAPHVEFPDVTPAVIFERDALAFPAVVGREPVTCVVSFELLVGFGSNDADEAVRVYQTQKANLHERARLLIAAGEVGEDGELLITTLA